MTTPSRRLAAARKRRSRAGGVSSTLDSRLRGNDEVASIIASFIAFEPRLFCCPIVHGPVVVVHQTLVVAVRGAGGDFELLKLRRLGAAGQRSGRRRSARDRH